MIESTHPTSVPAAADCGGLGRHPLELFAFFRRFPRSIGRDVVYSLIWNTMFAAIFALLAVVFDPPHSLDAFWRQYLLTTFVYANCIGFVIHFEFMVGDRLVPAIHRQSLAVRAAYYSLLPMVGVYFGFWIATSLLHWRQAPSAFLSAQTAASIGALSLVISGILLAIFIPRERAATAQAAFERERARVAAAERETTLAQLKVLEAQVEPHFLYNTLANAVSLVDSDPAGAKRMLERLIALLRAAAMSAEATVTLGQQAELVSAYLDILALRMGSRLAWSIDVPPELAPIAVAPMLLQPVVENAVKHGLEPKLDGGRVDVKARRDGERLELTVTDTGLGFGATRDPASTGIGLRNLRARLGALYGSRGTLTIEDRPPSGTRVVVSIPVSAPT